MHYRVRYSLDFDPKIRSGQVWDMYWFGSFFLYKWDQIENNFWNYPIFKDNDQSSTTAKKPEQSSSFLTNSPKDVTDEEVTTIQNLPRGQLIL